MISTTDSVPDAPSSDACNDALIHQLHAEIARYAVQLAQNKIHVVGNVETELECYCEVCQNVAATGEPLTHDDSCLIGRVFAISVEIARLNAAPSPRKIAYFPASTPAGEWTPPRVLTHEEAAARAKGVTR